MSRRFLLGVVVSLALVFLLVMALVPWTGFLEQRDQSHKSELHDSASQHSDTSHDVIQTEGETGHSHMDGSHVIGSPIASDNRRDIGYLQRNNRGQRDRRITICDYSSNNKKARARAFYGFYNPTLVGQSYDVDGAGGSCWYRGTDVNAQFHDTCNWRRSGAGCGPNSYHYR